CSTPPRSLGGVGANVIATARIRTRGRPLSVGVRRAGSRTGGKGDIYAADAFRRFVGWIAKVDEDAKHGRQGSVEDWAHYSALKHRLTANIDTLVAAARFDDVADNRRARL